ncbi:glycosyltransferase family 52 [Winogradskyella sp. UBA3174]|uniref:glycosyltransferase family 52 n=1 Tax=Winogradskyella sp. UBA3174 TaxID=1947785 RepID=UPI0025ECEE50|nr:glycosyltransferase family 52 [Winogradskyella sp. UBA3174]|tara:strand:+ start:22891 stop:23895 length:1005 start_codon:yes stop_codon:yes gene_type:complete
MQPKGIFVITSVYHILLSILLIEERKLKNNVLVIVEITPNIESLIAGLKKTEWFDDVILMIGRKKQKKRAGKFTYTFNRKKIVDLIDAENSGLNTIKNGNDNFDVYICSPDSAKNYFMYKYKNHDKYMIEDGLKSYVTEAPSFSKKLTSWLVNRPIVNGFDRRITKVFATTPNDLPEELKVKSEKLNWKETLKNLSPDKLNILSSAFLPDIDLDTESLFPKDKTKSIILTQTLNEDGVIEHEQEKLDICIDFIDQANTDIIYIKPHPRERTDYKVLFKTDSRIIVLPKLFPAELLNLHPNLKFKKAFTAFSTAIDNLEHVEEKISLGHAHFKRK